MSSDNSPNRQYSRRKALAVTGTGLVGALAGCSSVGTSKFQKQLDRAREATKQYEEPKQALKDGFKIGGPYVPGMGWHFSHPKRLQAAAKNGPSIEKPPILTYLEADSGLQLGALEYAIPVKAASNPDLFADEKAEATEKWHTHKSATHVFALPDGERTKPPSVSFEQWTDNHHWAEFRPPNPDLSAGDTVSLNWGSVHAKEGETKKRVVDVASTHPSLTTLHAWVHTKNPAGTFKPVNSKFADAGHSH